MHSSDHQRRPAGKEKKKNNKKGCCSYTLHNILPIAQLSTVITNGRHRELMLSKWRLTLGPCTNALRDSECNLSLHVQSAQIAIVNMLALTLHYILTESHLKVMECPLVNLRKIL